MSDENLIFNPEYSSFFTKNCASLYLTLNGEYIGDITHQVNKIPSMKNTNLFYSGPSNQYVILQKYDIGTHIIECIKQIYNFNIVPYNICIYKNKKYILYDYIPFTQQEYSLNKKKYVEVTDQERRIFLLHWLLGIKGKISNYNMNGINIVFSKGKYSKVDYDKNAMSNASLYRFFLDHDHLYIMLQFFKDDEKLNKIRLLFSDENYWWYQQIENKLESIVDMI